MTISRAAFIALAASLSFASLVGAAQARDHGVRPSVHHAEDYYAYSASEPGPAPTAESRGCFTTNSPMEGAKGIRHWSGRC